MKFTKLIPNVFYADISVGKKLFVDCLEFTIAYEEDAKSAHPLCILKKDHLAIHLVQDKEFAEKDRPELRIETNDIEAVYESVKTRFPKLLHPNLKKIKLQPWNVKEFALLDESGVCVIIQQL